MGGHCPTCRCVLPHAFAGRTTEDCHLCKQLWGWRGDRFLRTEVRSAEGYRQSSKLLDLGAARVYRREHHCAGRRPRAQHADEVHKLYGNWNHERSVVASRRVAANLPLSRFQGQSADLLAPVEAMGIGHFVAIASRRRMKKSPG